MYHRPNSLTFCDETMETPTMDQPSPGHLLHLPRELRDMVYAYLFIPATNDIPPMKKCNTSTRVRGTERTGGEVLYPLESPNYILLPLLHTCQQLRHEVLDVFEKFKRSKPDLTGYKLDLICLNPWIEYIPRWYHLLLPPPFYKTIEAVDVDMKVVLVTSRRDSFKGFSGWGGIPIGYYGLFDMLNHFLHHGPHFFYNPRLPEHKMPFINTINVRITYWKVRKYNDGRMEAIEVKDSCAREVYAWIVHLDWVGYMEGRVGTITSQGYYEHEWTVFRGQMSTKQRPPGETVKHYGEDIALSEEWERFGFKWGVNERLSRGNICQCENGPKWAEGLFARFGVFDGGHYHPYSDNSYWWSVADIKGYEID